MGNIFDAAARRLRALSVRLGRVVTCRMCGESGQSMTEYVLVIVVVAVLVSVGMKFLQGGDFMGLILRTVAKKVLGLLGGTG
ncbi:MAG: hypothetical protein WDA71_06545 [Actinomycetota bacterium]